MRVLRCTIRLAAAGVLAVLAVAGCGGGDEQQPGTSAPTTAPVTVEPAGTTATAVVTTGTSTPTTTATPTPTTTTGSGGGAAPQEPAEGEGGDERPARVPARFTVRDGGKLIEPRTVTVQAFFPIELIVTAAGAPAALTFGGGSLDPIAMRLDAGQAYRVTTKAVGPGSYVLSSLAGGEATVRAVRDAAGP